MRAPITLMGLALLMLLCSSGIGAQPVLSPPRRTEGPDLAGLVEQARRLRFQDINAAYGTVRAALERDRDDPRAHFILGRLHQSLGRLGDARAEFEGILGRHPRDVDGLVGLGEVALALQPPDLKGARQALEAAVGEAPNDPLTLFAYSQWALAAGERSRGLAALEEVVRLAPDHPMAHLQLGLERMNTGDWNRARTELEAAARLDPADPLPQLSLGLIYDALGQTDRAISAYQAALARAPKDPAALYNLAVDLEAVGRMDEALQTYQRLLAEDPAQPEARARMVALLVRTTAPEALLGPLRELVARQPQDPGAQLRLAHALLRSGQMDAARARYQRILALDPSNVAARMALARMAEDASRFDEAEGYYRSLLGDHPGSLDHGGEPPGASGRFRAKTAHGSARGSAPLACRAAGLALARVLERVGRAPEALAILDKWAEESPAPAEVHRNRARLLYVLNRIEEAREAAQKALEVEPDDPATLSFLASLDEAAGDREVALGLYTRAESLAPDDSNLRFRKGRCLEGLGRWLEAVEAYRTAMRLAPAEEGYAEALCRALGHVRDGNAGSRVEELEECGIRFPRSPQVLQAIVEALVAADRIPLAKGWAQRAGEECPDSAPNWQWFVAFYRSVGAEEEGMDALNRLCSGQEPRPWGALALAQLHVQRGDRLGAERWAERVLAYSLEHPEPPARQAGSPAGEWRAPARTPMGRLGAGAPTCPGGLPPGALPRALPWAVLARKRPVAPGAPPFALDAARVLISIGEPEVVMKQLEGKADAAPVAPPVLVALGEACEALGDRKAALSLFRRALEVDPDYRPARQGVDRLGEGASAGEWERGK